MNDLENLNEAARNGRLPREHMNRLEYLNEAMRNLRFGEQRNPGLKCYKNFLFCF
jgi:hypothetical protein